MTHKITVNCNFGNISYPVSFYIGNSAQDSHPIAFQARWLAATSGGKIPEKFMQSLEQVKKLSETNKVDFEELLCHMIEEANKPDISPFSNNNQ